MSIKLDSLLIQLEGMSLSYLHKQTHDLNSVTDTIDFAQQIIDLTQVQISRFLRFVHYTYGDRSQQIVQLLL